MPRKQRSDAKSSPATGKPEPTLSSQPARAGKSAARSAAAEGEPGAASKSTSLPRRRVANRSKKAAEARAALPLANPPQTTADTDGFRAAVSSLAYHFWEVRASAQGSPDEDWVRAEKALQEVLEKLSSTSA